MDNKKEYALYKGENLLSIGTIEEITSKKYQLENSV